MPRKLDNLETRIDAIRAESTPAFIDPLIAKVLEMQGISEEEYLTSLDADAMQAQHEQLQTMNADQLREYSKKLAAEVLEAPTPLSTASMGEKFEHQTMMKLAQMLNE